MRIVGGEAGGRRIQAPEGRETRPTTERVREAIFSILGGDMTGDVVLDVFSGSGAMALEAISRGAESAVMFDSSRQAGNIIRKNIAALGYGGKARFINREWKPALAGISGVQFTVVFIDPPYKRVEEYMAVITELKARDLLTDGAHLVLEHELKTAWAEFPEGFEPLKPHKYGETAVTLLRYTRKQEQAGDEA